jgi:hypothetical protein
MSPPRRDRSPQLLALLESKPAVTLPEIRTTLAGSRATAFRYLRQIPYRRSYNHNGRYYTRHDPARYDRHGLWAHEGIYFSRDGSLKATVYRLVREAEAGWTHRELRDLLRVRVQFVLVEGVHEGVMNRQRMEGLFVYVNHDAEIQAAQLEQRRRRIESGAEAKPIEVADAVVIQVLLVLIRRPGSQPAEVVRHLRGHVPPIVHAQVDAVFTRYYLGEKGGPSIS